MNKETVFFLLGIVMAAAGCTLAPQYSRPAAPVPDKWEVRAADQASHIQALKWRQFYIDENLKQLIETALINNRDLRLSALSMERARGLYGIQRAEILPAVNAVGIGGKQHEGAAITEDGKSVTFEEYRADLRISSWEIDFFGRIRSLKDQALEEYLATEAARNSAQIALISSVAQTYLTLAADREALTIASSTLAAQQAAYDLMQQRYNVGVVSELDLKRVQTQVDSARGDIARYKQQVALDVNALGLLLGSQAQNSLLPSDLSSVAIPQEIFPGLNSEVLLSRPDILAAEHRLKGAYANIGAARAVFFPRISLTTAIGTASSDLSGLFESGSGTWSFTPQVSLPIFDARTWSALTVSKTDQQIALTQYEKAIQTAFKEVADSLAVLVTVEDQLAAQQSLFNALSDSYRLSNERYARGVDSYLGVLDAQRSLYAAQQGLVGLRLAKLANMVNLYAVLGGGAE
ncbi:MAG: efflux transporter outer membrane subunit [Desulfobacterales bacterium]|nr:efflux transporter outer membrane subunit [Desulfobacterales bacterium]